MAAIFVVSISSSYGSSNVRAFFEEISFTGKSQGKNLHCSYELIEGDFFGEVSYIWFSLHHYYLLYMYTGEYFREKNK